MSQANLVVAITTFPERSQAAEMARLVIENNVAACAQVDGPIESSYRWEGQICVDTEWRLTMKTTVSSELGLRELVLRNHPYQQPQWIVLEVTSATEGYENWVRQSLQGKAQDS